MLVLFIFAALVNPPLAGGMLLGMILFLPFLIFFQSLQTLLMVPLSLWQTFTDKQVRRNHALEHATANVLESGFGATRVAGMAFRDGYKLAGDLPHPAFLIQAAQEALRRLKNGETHLALHPRCGTSMLIGQFFFSLVFVIFFVFAKALTLFDLLAAFLFSAILAKPLGLLAQKYITTSTDVEDLYFKNLSIDWTGQFYFQTGSRDLVSSFPSGRQWILEPVVKYWR